VHPTSLTAAGYNGSNPAVALDLLGGLVSLPLAPHGGNQARRQGGSGAGERVHEGIVRMLAGELVNLFVIERDGRQDLFQHYKSKIYPSAEPTISHATRNLLRDPLERSLLVCNVV
jgi:hypothetical protein